MRSQINVLAVVLLTSNVSGSPGRRSRRKNRRRQIEPIATKLHSSKETLRDRWIDLLHSSYDESNAIRLENQDEQDYYYSAEMLADQLLGLDPDNRLLLAPRRGKSANPLTSKLWESVALGSTGVVAIFPLALFFLEVLPSNFLSSAAACLAAKVTTFHTSLTPYLFPTIQTIQASVKDQLIQAQSIIASLPYLLRHLRRIQLVPLTMKLIRKCIILEAWRHIWIRIYKISKKLWKGTRVGSAKAYSKFVPAWIRRGINSTFKSMVQAQVHGVVGSAMGGIYVSIMGDGLESAMSEMPIDGVLETTVDASVDAASEQMANAVESVVESVADSSVVDAISESLSSAVDDAITDGLSSVIEESVESATDAISESFDSAVDSILDGME